jgi:hypothetical protein
LGEVVGEVIAEHEEFGGKAGRVGALGGGGAGGEGEEKDERQKMKDERWVGGACWHYDAPELGGDGVDCMR